MRRLLATAALLLIPLSGNVLAKATVEELIEELGKPAHQRLIDRNGGRTGPNPFTAYEVVKALAGIGEPAKAAIPALVKALGENYLHVPRDRIGRPTPPPDFRVAAAELLARFKPDSVLPLLDALATGNANARRFALVALGRMGEDAALHVASIAKALGDEAEDVRFEAAVALARIGWKAAEAVPSLIEKLAERGHRERLARLRAVAAIRTGSSEALDAFTRAVEDRKLEIDPKTFRAILDWLGSLGEKGVPGLVALIRRDPHRVQRTQQGRQAAEA
ncbi:MAG: HEAT repeat domain-containing protein, partial [Planctomycetota bacterium]